MRSQKFKRIKLSKRLQSLYDLIEKDSSQTLYDLCCDHGDLGLRVAQDGIASTVFLIDRVPSIIDALSVRIEATDIPSGVKIFALCEDSSQTQKTIKNSTLILAGIGEDTAISILEQIDLCPKCHLILGVHSENFELREYLKNKGFGLIAEKVIKDKGKLYELIKVSKCSKTPLNTVGSEQWSCDNPASIELLNKRIRYLEIKLSHQKNVKYEDYLKNLKLRSENLT